MQKLPKSDFRWMGENEINQFDIDTVDLEGDLGYIIECDLKYPKKIHNNSHNCLTLAPECLEISDANLSPYAKKALVDSGCKEKYKDAKLVATFYDRKNYVIHCKNLKLYTDLGMKLLKIHKILEFRQEDFIAPYIEMCTLARKNSTSKFDINQFKKLVSPPESKANATCFALRGYYLKNIFSNNFYICNDKCNCFSVASCPYSPSYNFKFTFKTI